MWQGAELAEGRVEANSNRIWEKAPHRNVAVDVLHRISRVFSCL